MADQEEKKGLFDQFLDAVTNRDEKAAAEKAAAEKAAAEQAAKDAAAREEARKQAEARNAAAKAAADAKAVAEKAAADAAAKAAAEKAAAAQQAQQAAAEMAAAKQHGPAAPQANAPMGMPAQRVKKGVVQVDSLRIRKDHTTKSGLAGGLVRGNEVTILETFSDGKDTWAKLGEGQWAAMIYDGETYIKMTE